MFYLIIVVIIFPAFSIAFDCADVNSSGNINILDVTHLIAYLYQGGPGPDCQCSIEGDCGDVDNSGLINILDITYLLSYIYMQGPAPICGCGTVVDIDGNEYETVQIGDQCWLAENLKVTHYRNGDSIPNLTHGWSGTSSGAYCNYNNDSANVAIYGRLYNGYAVIDGRGLAPEGWHVPTDDEWKQLEMFLGMSQAAADSDLYRGIDEGGKLKESGIIHWNDPNAGATDEVCFTALPGGLRDVSVGFSGLGIWAGFWSSTSGWYRRLDSDSAGIWRYVALATQNGYSVRCIKD
jgi:uncharacterized protein (TIGR02145 family)